MVVWGTAADATTRSNDLKTNESAPAISILCRYGSRGGGRHARAVSLSHNLTANTTNLGQVMLILGVGGGGVEAPRGRGRYEASSF